MLENGKKISVVIPSYDGSRGGNVQRLKDQLNSQTLKPDEIIVVVGVSPNGRARNKGAEKANGDYLVFIDDDVTLGNDRVLEKLIRPMEDGPSIGLTGPSQLIPEDSNWFQRAAAKQVPRSTFPVQSELVDSDMVTHMCLCVPAPFFREIGMENADIIAGTDPDLRHRVRQAGRRVCVVPDCWAYHPMPETFFKFLRLAFKKGSNSAIVRRDHPELVLELDDGFKTSFESRRTLSGRITRTLKNVLVALFTLQLINLSNLCVYALGNLWESTRTRRKP